jgi:hypothetical protein
LPAVFGVWFERRPFQAVLRRCYPKRPPFEPCQATLGNNTLWAFLIVCYGVFIPNTWRRCVGVVAVRALLPPAITVAAGLGRPSYDVLR